MKHVYPIKMRTPLWAMLGVTCFAFVPSVAFGGWVGDTMCACPGRHKPLGNNANCEDACYGTRSAPSGGNPSPSYDYGAAQRAQQAAAAAEAERQRQQAEAERLERERQAEIKRQKDAAFIRDRDAAANSLKGSSGPAMGQLKGLSGTDNSGLKGSGFDTGSTGLKELRGSGYDDQKSRLQPETARTSLRVQLLAREKELTAAIQRDLLAIERLGFKRRAQDIEEWAQLSADAKRAFEDEIKGKALDAVLSRSKDALLKGLGGFDANKAKVWTEKLNSRSPRPDGLISAIEKFARTGGERRIEDAEALLKEIERYGKLKGVDSGEKSAEAALDLVCEFTPSPLQAQCEALRTITELTISSLYNNATRRVAAREIERLTTLTEEQLKALNKLNMLLAKHVQERNEIRLALKETKASVGCTLHAPWCAQRTLHTASKSKPV